MTYAEQVYWNTNSYGNAVKISSKWLKSINMMLAFIIVGLYPVPLALFINRYIKDMVIRWE